MFASSRRWSVLAKLIFDPEKKVNSNDRTSHLVRWCRIQIVAPLKRASAKTVDAAYGR
jgi:hypothetical protein